MIVSIVPQITFCMKTLNRRESFIIEVMLRFCIPYEEKMKTI